MATYRKGKDGRFTGSIAGAANVPTASAQRAGNSPSGAGTAAGPDSAGTPVTAVYQRYKAATAPPPVAVARQRLAQRKAARNDVTNLDDVHQQALAEGYEAMRVAGDERWCGYAEASDVIEEEDRWARMDSPSGQIAGPNPATWQHEWEGEDLVKAGFGLEGVTETVDDAQDEENIVGRAYTAKLTREDGRRVDVTHRVEVSHPDGWGRPEQPSYRVRRETRASASTNAEYDEADVEYLANPHGVPGDELFDDVLAAQDYALEATLDAQREWDESLFSE